MKWDDPVSRIKGVGPKKTEYLARKNIYTIEDLLSIFPSRYIDRNYMPKQEDVIDNELITFKGVFEKIGRVQFFQGNKNLFSGNINWDDTKVIITYFNQPYLRNSLKIDVAYYVFGRIKKQGRQLKMINPQVVEIKNSKSFFKLEPIYPQIEGLNKNALAKMIEIVFKESIEWPMDLPEAFCEQYDLYSNKIAYRHIHKPDNFIEVNKAKKRFKYDEALKINCGIIASLNESNNSDIEISYLAGLDIFINSLPFELTKDQSKIILEIVKELKDKKVINRLIQGDVGSGKTVIAVAIACVMAQNGYQVAYMAPTEILAGQHYETFKDLLKNTGIKIGILTGGLSKKEQTVIKDNLKIGELSIIIGTHALFQDDVDYYNLGLVITDEQHRFGVRQKAKLIKKGVEPHTLVMSATPIPRTLALVFYGDLSVSYLNEMPKGRKRVKTHCYNERKLPQIYDFIEAEMKKDKQAFVICPFVESSEIVKEVNDIESVFKELELFYQPNFKIGFLHGKKSNDEKNKILSEFNQGKIKLLVATSIIEVGIDVPKASVILILNAERFGLAQLHQLRGRVGRSNIQSYCFLITNSKNKETIERMEVIVKNYNGNDIAKEDLKLRGPGDYFGYKQHGLPDMRWLNPLEDMLIIEETRIIAQKLKESKEIYYKEILNSFFQSIEDISLN